MLGDLESLYPPCRVSDLRASLYYVRLTIADLAKMEPILLELLLGLSESDRAHGAHLARWACRSRLHAERVRIILGNLLYEQGDGMDPPPAPDEAPDDTS